MGHCQHAIQHSIQPDCGDSSNHVSNAKRLDETQTEHLFDHANPVSNSIAGRYRLRSFREVELHSSFQSRGRQHFELNERRYCRVD